MSYDSNVVRLRQQPSIQDLLGQDVGHCKCAEEVRKLRLSQTFRRRYWEEHSGHSVSDADGDACHASDAPLRRDRDVDSCHAWDVSHC